MAFAHVDGSPHKTDNSALMNKLEGMIVSNPSAEIDVSIVDAMFFIRTLSNLPSTFGGVAGVILKIICQLAKYQDSLKLPFSDFLQYSGRVMSTLTHWKDTLCTLPCF